MRSPFPFSLMVSSALLFILPAAVSARGNLKKHRSRRNLVICELLCDNISSHFCYFCKGELIETSFHLPFFSSSADAAPKPSPGTPSTPHRLCADKTSSYYEATEDCSGYVYCMMGTPDKPYYCGSGQLYDEVRSTSCKLFAIRGTTVFVYDEVLDQFCVPNLLLHGN